MPEAKFYTLNQIAKEGGVAQATIVRRIETRKVKVRKKKDVRGHWVFTAADLQTLKAHNGRIKSR